MKKIFSLFLILCMVMCMAGCGPMQPLDGDGMVNETVVTDMIGREVKINPGVYSNVVCIGAGALRMYSYVGDMDLICGVEDIDNLSLDERPKMFDAVARPYLLANAEILKSLPSCGTGGPNAQAAEAEKILSCNPDVVISLYTDVEKADALQQQLGIPVVTLASGINGVFSDEFAGSIKLLGMIFGKEERAEEIVDFISREREAISERTSLVSAESPDAYICGLGNWGTTNHLMTASKYINFDIAGISNVVKDMGEQAIFAIEEEKFVELGQHMDIMFIDAAAVKNIKPLYEEDNTMFDTAKAWQDGNVYLEMAYNAYYTNYEIALANAWFMAKTVFPEEFEDIDIKDKLNEITTVFEGCELADEIYACPASYGGYQKIDTETFFK